MANQKQPQPPEFPWTQPNGVYGTYDLHCHCGAIRLTMKYSPPLYAEHAGADGKRATAVECNCSHCARVGMINVHPLAADVQFTRGLEDRVEYYCASGKCPHWHCRKCGCVVGTDLSRLMTGMGMEERYSVNVRMLKDYDPEKIQVRKVTMMEDAPPKYEIPG